MKTRFDTLLVEPQGEHVIVVSLNRPAGMNALRFERPAAPVSPAPQIGEHTYRSCLGSGLVMSR